MDEHVLEREQQRPPPPRRRRRRAQEGEHVDVVVDVGDSAHELKDRGWLEEIGGRLGVGGGGSVLHNAQDVVEEDLFETVVCVEWKNWTNGLVSPWDFKGVDRGGGDVGLGPRGTDMHARSVETNDVVGRIGLGTAQMGNGDCDATNVM